jgi:hypothetical protein
MDLTFETYELLSELLLTKELITPDVHINLFTFG